MKALLFSDKAVVTGQIASLLRNDFELYFLAYSKDYERLKDYGAKEIIVLNEEYSSADSIAYMIASYIKDYDYVFIGATVLGREVGAIASVISGVEMKSEITEFSIVGDKTRTKRLYYGGKTMLEEKSSARILTVSQGLREAETRAASSEIINAKFNRKSVIEIDEKIQKSTTSVDITKADIIVSIGRGLSKKEDMPIIADLANAIHAELAGSRPVCADYHWLEEDRQVGLSGKKVTPKLYIAIGISGQIQHIAGMRGSKTVIAINKDKNAPIFSECDYGIIGDLYSVVPKLTTALKK